MSTSYTASRWIATATGCAAMALIGYSNVSKALSAGVAWSDPAVLTAGGIALFGAAAIYAAACAWAQGRRVIALGLLVAVSFSETGNAYNILEGLLLGRDARLQLIKDHNAAIDLANASKAATDKVIADLEEKIAAETLTRCKSVCEDFKVQLAAAKVEAQAKAQALAALGARRSEKNIVAETLGVDELWIEAVPPLLTTLSLLAFSMGLLAFGHGGPSVPLATSAASVPSIDERTEQILDAIRKSGGSLPSNQALASLLNVSEAQASKLATALVESGHIERRRDGKRAELRLVVNKAA